MELRHLRAFEAVLAHGHFGRAAESLHLAQPALSQQVRQLERELGVALFERTTRRVTVTDAGRRLATHSRSVLGAVDETYADMRSLAQGRTGRVSVGFVGTATYDVLPRVAEEVRAHLPGVDLSVRGELLSPVLADGLRDRVYDLALLRRGAWSGDGMVVRTVRSERLVAAIPRTHRLGRRRRVELGELSQEPFLTHPSGTLSSFHPVVLAACAEAGFTPRVVAEAGETATLMVLVAAGQGVALVPDPVRSLGLAGVAYVDLVGGPSVDLVLAHRADDLSPAARQVADVVVRSTEGDVRGDVGDA